MSGGTACKCKPRTVRVLQYRSNHSAFNGYRHTRSAYSAVECVTCGARWRTKAAYVERAGT
jgi:hypothetical protein